MLFRSRSLGRSAFNDRLIVLAGIDSYMMLFDCVHSRLNTDSFINFIRKLLPAVCAKEFLQFLRPKEYEGSLQPEDLLNLPYVSLSFSDG